MQWETKTRDQCFMDLHWPQSHTGPEQISVCVDFVRREYKRWDIFLDSELFSACWRLLPVFKLKI